MKTDGSNLAYRRVLLKISGEALMGDQGYGIDVPAVTKYAEEIKSAIELGCQICLGARFNVDVRLASDAQGGALRKNFVGI